MPQVDVLGNELGGVETTEILAPLATHTAWNLRYGFLGGSDELTDFRGTFIPLPATETEREANGDPRPSIESLYPGKEEYLMAVEQAARSLVKKGLLLEEDIGATRGRASLYWDWIFRD